MRSTAGMPARRNGRVVVVDRHLIARREDGADAHALRGRAHARPQRRCRAALARQAHALIGDVVEQHHLPDLAAVRGDVGARAAQRARGRSARSGSRGPPPRRRRARSAPRARRSQPQVARELDDRRRAGRAVVGADEALGVVLAVVVGAERRSPARGPGSVPTMLRRPGWPVRDRLEAPVGQLRGAGPRRAGAAAREPAGRWP